MADSVSLTFENQKNGERMETVTQAATHTDLCPVQSWAATIHRILTYPDSTIKSPVDAFRVNERTFAISGAVMRATLRRAVRELGESTLNITADDVGTHSIRASFAMLLLLNGEEDSLVMKKGRWKSNAFLAYIRSQISTYGLHASKTMLQTHTGDFVVLPHFGNIKIKR